MRNILTLGGAALLVFAGLGWYLGWYKVQSTPTSDGHRHINIDLDTNKIKADVAKGKDKLRDLLTTDKNQQPANNTLPTGNTQPTSNNPGSTNTSFRPSNDGGFIFPGTDVQITFPTPPAGSPSLPAPR